MAMLLVMQMSLFSLVMAQEQFGDSRLTDGSWSSITQGRQASQPTAISCLLQSQPVARRDDYIYTPGIGGHKLHTHALKWNDARRMCEEEGGHLAIINSIAESRVIVDLFNRSGAIVGATGIFSGYYVSIGFHDLFNEGEYLTIHGQSIARAGFNQWTPGQPDNAYDGENCGSVHRSGRLNDISCHTTYGFICELPWVD